MPNPSRERPRTCRNSFSRCGIPFALVLLLLTGLGFGCKDSSPPDRKEARQAPSVRPAQPDWDALFAQDPEAFREFQDIRALTNASKYREAAEGLKKLIARSPSAPWAEQVEILLIQTLRLVPDNPAALQEAEAFLKRRPESPEATRVLLYKGEICLELGTNTPGRSEGGPQAMSSYVEQAKEVFQSLLARPSEDRALQAQTWFLLAAAFMAEGNAEHAAAAYRKVADEYTDTSYAPKALYRLAGVLLGQNRVSIARETFQEIVDRFPQSSEAGKSREKLVGLALVGKQAPALRVREWVGGPAQDLAALRGRVVMLEFWAMWCPHCRASLPKTEKLQERFGSRGLVVIGVSRERTGYEADKIRKFVESRPMGFATGIDDGGKTSDAYGIENIPCAVVIDRQGLVRWHGHPEYLTDQVIEDMLAPSA
jgi:outer membrane protein assembly factor BamD (BamD/ComL family)/thiol-disulfide isomerase/thioredoxin